MRKQRLNLKSTLILTLILFCIQKGFAQFTLAEIGVNGLTCSQCSRSVEMSLLKLDFIKDVQMNLENTVGKITFKKGAEVSLKKIAKAVTGAGFSVGYFRIAYSFNNQDVGSGVSLVNASGEFCFVNTEIKKLHGEVLLTVVNKEFMPKLEYKRWKEAIKKSCAESKKETYYVTLQDLPKE